MKLTAKSYYALLATAELGRHYGSGPIKASEIARRLGIPSRFLELTLHELKTAGIVDSRKGAEGGFFLASDPRTITPLAVISITEGNLLSLECDKLTVGGACPLEGYFDGLRRAMREYLGNSTLAELADIMQKESGAIHFSI